MKDRKLFPASFSLQLDRYLLTALVFFLPLFKQVIPFIISLLIIKWLISGHFLKLPAAIKQSKQNAYLLLFSAYYLLHIIGLINTDNLDAGWFDLEVKASLLIFPVIFIRFDKKIIDNKWLMRILAAYLLGCAVSVLICLSRAAWLYLDDGDRMQFFYSGLSYFHHPSYMAMYLNFAIAIGIFLLIECRQQMWKSGVWLTLFSGFLFMWFIVLLSSKAGILGLILTLFLGMVYLIIRQKLLVQGIAGFLITIIFFFFMLNAFPYSVVRLKSATQAIEGSDRLQQDETEGTAKRILIWRVGTQLAWEHFLTGAGTGDVKGALMQEYDRLGMTSASAQKLNAHNQYLQTTIALGVIGLLMLALSLLLPMIEAYRSKHFPYFLFLVLIGFNLLFESMLETQAGVVFYAFFNAFFFATRKGMDAEAA